MKLSERLQKCFSQGQAFDINKTITEIRQLEDNQRTNADEYFEEKLKDPEYANEYHLLRDKHIWALEEKVDDLTDDADLLAGLIEMMTESSNYTFFNAMTEPREALAAAVEKWRAQK